jgi:hypothetical protein
MERTSEDLLVGCSECAPVNMSCRSRPDDVYHLPPDLLRGHDRAKVHLGGSRINNLVLSITTKMNGQI